MFPNTKDEVSLLSADYSRPFVVHLLVSLLIFNVIYDNSFGFRNSLSHPQSFDT